MNIEDAEGPGVNTDLIAKLRQWGIAYLTDIQIRALAAGVANNESLIVSAPTSSGKTLIGEIALLKAAQNGHKAIYLVSHKALADQKYLDFVRRFGEGAETPISTVSLNTGDRTEGNLDATITVATYEKALGLIASNQIKAENCLIVADELQIVGDPSRGPDIETLCAIFRQRRAKQFIALTATTANPEDIAGWMCCSLVQSTVRDVPLHQEIWHAGRCYRLTFGDTDGIEIADGKQRPRDVSAVVSALLENGLGPVLVFTESRREATEHANAFGHSRPRATIGISIAEQLDFFSEPTESSEQLKANAERRVIFHTADLSPQERQVIEGAFTESQFDVCFATSTLAAGVNFPFRSIVFSKLTFQWGSRAGTHLPKPDFRNMSGRAGRLGMHENGYAILLPRDGVELAHAHKLIEPNNDPIVSQFINLSLRKSVLMLAASRLAHSFEDVIEFFKNTLFWYQTLERNPGNLEKLASETKLAIEWLTNNGMLEMAGAALRPTPLGLATALSGLLPSTALQLAIMLREMGTSLLNFDDCVPAIVHRICSSDEFTAEKPSRFFPWPTRTTYDSVTFWAAKRLYTPLDRTNLQLAQCAHAAMLYIDGIPERKITYATNLASGAVHRLSIDLAWVLDGLHKLSSVPELGCTQGTSNNIAMLARRMRWGAPVEALDVMRIAEKHAVPGFGRQRAMALLAQGIATVHDVLSTTKNKLAELLRNDRRAQALIEAASSTAGIESNRLATAQFEVAKTLGISELVDKTNKSLGTDYEKAIIDLLKVEASWIVINLDDGKRQNVPDIQISLGNKTILLECKTCSKYPTLIKKEEAWAVLQKSADFDPAMRRVTLGKPAFDETSKKKAAAASDITLIEHGIFLEGVLRVHTGSLEPEAFMEWLSKPGVTELDRLGGTATYVR